MQANLQAVRILWLSSNFTVSFPAKRCKAMTYHITYAAASIHPSIKPSIPPSIHLSIKPTIHPTAQTHFIEAHFIILFRSGTGYFSLSSTNSLLLQTGPFNHER